MGRNKKKNKVVLCMLLCLTAMLIMSGCEITSGSKNVTYQGSVASKKTSEQQALTGVVTNVDDTLSQITFRELDSDVDTILNYNVATNILDDNQKLIMPEDLQIGVIMEAEYDVSNAEISKMYVPDDIWEYEDVDNYTIKTDENMLCVAGGKYEVGNQTCFLEHGKKLEQAEIDPMDVLTIRGRGYQVYSVVREKGHGYLTLQNYNDYVGGMINPGNGKIYRVTKNMMLTLPVGTKRVTMWKGGLKVQKTVIIKANQETIADFSGQGQKVKGIGQITFQIEPAGADLILNGKRIDYSKPVKLRYGVYQVAVSMTGYTPYSGTLDVEEEKSKIRIDLVRQQADVSNQTAAPKTTAKKKTSPTATPEVTESPLKKDINHIITVKSPEGASVYVDNVYKGIVPCKFPKIIGSQTLVLIQEGYEAKSYNIDIEDDDKNTTLTFPKLEKSS